MATKSIGVIGAGTMGTGIARVAALAGLEVVLRDIETKYVEASVSRMAASMDNAVSKGKMQPDEKEAALGRIKTTTSLEDLKDVDIVIEAVLEDLKLKQAVFQELKRYLQGRDSLRDEHFIHVNYRDRGCFRKIGSFLWHPFFQSCPRDETR